MQIIYDLKNAIDEENLTNERILVIKDLINEKFPKSLGKQKKVYEIICKEIIKNINSGDLVSALNLLKLIYLSENHSLGHNYIKSIGIFRSTKYEYNYKPLLELINSIKNFLISININLYSDYFDSVCNILILSDDIKIEYEKIISFLNNKEALRLVLNNCDHTFIINTINPLFFHSYNCIEEMVIKSNFYSPEEICNSISTIVSIYIDSNIKGLIPTANLNSLPDCNHDIKEALSSAYKINKYKEIEIDVGVFEYQAININNKIYIDGGVFERQKRIGYFLSDQKRLSNAVETFSKFKKDNFLEFKSLYEILKDISSSEDSEFKPYIIAKNPDRFLIKIPLNFFKTKEYSPQKIHLEDLVKFSQIYYENYLFNKITSIDEISNTIIHNNYSVMNYLNLSKIFNLSNYALQIAYHENSDKLPNADQILSNSLLSIISKEQLKYILSYIGIINSIDELDDFLSPITLDINKENHHVDLQYTPILKINDLEYLILNATSFNSDLIRRICIHNKFSFSIDASEEVNKDQMVVEMQKCFQAQNFLVKTDFEFSKFELDFLALKDNSLFIFECKNPYLPVNSHELRNIYDHIQHAFFQLERAKSELEDKNKLRQLFENLGWSEHYNSDIKVFYGVCNANRMLVGYNKNNIYVHHAHQIINLLTSGEILNFDHTESIWEAEKFQTTDLIRFITGGSISQNYDEFTEKYHFNFETSNYEISIESYLSGMPFIRKNHKIEEKISVKLENYL
ncbi:hypothetical protein [Acinetobacter baumannii]|uniref:hypothetical protein n=1 Tax=Acinetobacter baumannii TaxID=470 RepID=UPI00135F3CC7|nr:hypothetical protein [Acinetobacter baumannii]CAA0220189.1 hypothetical protein AB571B5_01969 [Acinetobacter baumannii]